RGRGDAGASVPEPRQGRASRLGGAEGLVDETVDDVRRQARALDPAACEEPGRGRIVEPQVLRQVGAVRLEHLRDRALEGRRLVERLAAGVDEADAVDAEPLR